MLVKNDIAGKTYKNLMNYVFKKCDAILVEQYHDQHKERHKKIIKYLEKQNYNSEYIYNNYSQKLLNDLYDTFKKDKMIINNIDNYNAKQSFASPIKWLYYEKNVKLWLKRNNEYILKKIEKKAQNIHISTVYCLQLVPEIKEEVLSKKHLYTSWLFPNSVENICFFKNGCCWLYSVAHEKLCDIFCKNEEEYEYLKSIGIEFFEENFSPTPKDELYYEEY